MNDTWIVSSDGRLVNLGSMTTIVIDDYSDSSGVYATTDATRIRIFYGTYEECVAYTERLILRLYAIDTRKWVE